MSDNILTKRLTLRPLERIDLEDLVTLHGDPEVMRGSSGQPVARTRAETVEWLKRALSIPAHPVWGHFRVEDAATTAFLGRCGLRPEANGTETELAYSFARHAWGRGIASEAARAVVERAFRGGFLCIAADVLSTNVASQRVLEKLGMSRVSDPLSGQTALIRYRTGCEMEP